VNFELTEEQALIRATARRIAEAELIPKAAQIDREGIFPEAQMKILAENGFLAMLVEEAYGGIEAGAVSYSLALTEIARGCAATAVTMAVTNMVADAINAFGNEEQKNHWIPKIASGEMLCAAFSLSEPGAGSDAASLNTTALKDGDNYILNGEKCWVTSGDRAGLILVMAKTDPSERSKGISTFLIEPGTPGFSVGRHEEKMGLRGSSTVSLNFEDARVPAANRLGPEGIGFKIAMRALDGGRIGIGSQALGVHQACLEASTHYSLDRKQFSKALSDFQAIQFKLADMATTHDAARLMVLRAALLKDQGLPFTQEASMAKLFATEAANTAALDAIQIHGGYGYTDEFPVERYLRDVRVTTIYEGTSEIQRLVIARSVLS
jgi:hypothetical protein